MKLFNHPLIRLLFALCIVFLPLVLLEGMISGELGILLGILVSFIAYIFYVKFWEKRPVYELRITNKSDSVIYKYFGLVASSIADKSFFNRPNHFQINYIFQ